MTNRKNIYLDEGSIKDFTDSALREFSTRREISYKRPALLILDMQRFFLESNSHAFIPSAPSIISRIKRLKQFCQKHAHLVYLTRHLNSIENAKMVQNWWRDLITEDNPYSGIISDLSDVENRIITKPQYDAFYSTDLENELRFNGINQVIITGVMTHLCCETTARSAFMRGFEVIFPADGTATYNEDFHQATLLNLSHGFAHITSIDRIISQLQDCDE